MAVDDNSANLKLITALLAERVETVVPCINGQQAVQAAETQAFDIILMDIQMPHMDGVTASKQIKQLKTNQNTPIIAVTAHAMSGERERLIDAGMDDYLTKPIDELMLQQVLVDWTPNSVQLVESADRSEKEPHIAADIDSEAHSRSIPHDSMCAIDWPLALKQAANKPELAQDMLKMLIDYIDEVDQIVADTLSDGAAHQSQEASLLEHVHRLHGSCSYSGVPRLKAVCAQIETSLRAGESVQAIEPELFELQDEMAKVQHESVEYLP
jgi:two-component system sensor histidine kinase BarA